MKKNLKDVQRSMILFRSPQATSRSIEIEDNHIENTDKSSRNYEGLYSKGFSHDPNTLIGESSEIKDLQIALNDGDQADFNNIAKAGDRKQASPQASLSFENMGGDPAGFEMPVPPSLSSRVTAAEMAEVYEKCILRDKTFSNLNEGGSDVDIERAITTLNSFGDDFKGPKSGGIVSRKVLFRGIGPNEDVGPYVSQFLLHPVPFGAQIIEQKYTQRVGAYGIKKSELLSIQEGYMPGNNGLPTQSTGASRYVSTPRDLGSLVHVDFIFQNYLYAAAIASSFSRQSAFPTLAKEGSFVTNAGIADIACAVSEVARHALKAAWFQKWINHLRLRPEAMAAKIELSSSLVHSDILLGGAADATIQAVKSYNTSQGGENSAWLPLLYAEGSPTHPSYPAGHAVISGACVTLLKIFLADANWSTTGLSVFESLNGTNLTAYAGADSSNMTIHGELNKLASNMAIGRNMAGVHYRSDGDEGIILGEKVAIQYFKDLREQQNENIGSPSIVKFDGDVLNI